MGALTYAGGAGYGARQPYLPSSEASELIENKEASVGPLREELHDELKRPPAQSTKLYANPRLCGVQFKPVPHFVLRLPIPSRIMQVGNVQWSRRVHSMLSLGPCRYTSTAIQY